MPGRKKYRKRKRAKVYVKEKADYRRLMAMPQSGNIVSRKTFPAASVGFPRQKTVTLRYVGGFQLTSTSGALASYKFRANGIYDPDYSGGGHQPYLHDTWQTLYNHYMVKSSRITINFSTLNGNVNPLVVGMYLADDVTTSLDYTSLAEAGRGTCRLIQGVNTESYSVSTSYSRKAWFAKDANQSAVFGNDPADEAFYMFYIQSADQLSTTGPIQGIATIEYTIDLSEPRDIAQS